MNLKNLITLTIGILFLISGIFLYFNNAPPGMRDEIFQIKSGETLNRVASRLKEKNLISHQKFYVILSLLEGRSKVLIGKYKIYKNMTTREIIKRLSRGDIIKRKVTIPEGFNLYEIAEKLDRNEITNSDDFLRRSFDSNFLRSIGILYPSAEGLLFPDTYTFAEAKDARDVITGMHFHLKNTLKTINLKNLKKLNLNIYELLNLASLIEKEAKAPSERKYISAVFHNRLKRNIKLGCDPTVRYAVKKFKGRIRYKDLKKNSPYNTYLYPGLPPSPICSPGKDSIIAALNPVKTNYLYFVARNDGSHYFSKNLKEHNRAVEYYQKGVKNGFIDKQKL